MPTDEAADLARNRELWSLVNAQFTDRQADQAWAATEIGWGMFRTPETDVGALGSVDGLDVLELASGTAYFGSWLARLGARVVATDLASEQLTSAKRCMQAYGPWFPLVQADSQRLPLADDSFDLVVSENGVAAWCDPTRWIPEAARVLRPGGRLVFLTNSTLSALCVPSDAGVATEVLQRPQRASHRIEWVGGGVEYHPSHGTWIRLLRQSGFVIEALHELYAPTAAADHEFYEITSADWASQWPAEELWVTRLAM